MASRPLRSASRLNAASRSRSGELAEDLREVGGVLLLQQIQQVGGRTDAQQSLDRVEDEIDSSLRRHVTAPRMHKILLR